MPHQDIISGFKGVIDFYLYKGQPCARKWPIWRPRDPTPEERANQELFAYINKASRELPPFIKEQLKNQAAGTPFTWKDLLVRAYLKGIEY